MNNHMILLGYFYYIIMNKYEQYQITCLLTRPLSIHLRSRQLSYLSPRLTDPRPHAWWFRRAMRGAPRCRCIGFKDYLLSSAAAPRMRTIACGGSLFPHPKSDTQIV
jgi:hypothetical protein